MSSPPAVALFDIDGTLYPHDSRLTRDLDWCITEYVSARLGVSTEQADRLRAETLKTRGTTLRGMIELHGVDPVDFYDFLAAIDPRDYLTPDLALCELLDRVSARLCALTNAPPFHAERVLEALGLPGVFERVYDIEFSGYLGKPASGTYEAVLRDLAVPARCVTLIDDTPRFLPPAKSLGMRTVLVGSEPATAADFDARCDSIHELDSAAPWLFRSVAAASA